MTRRTTKVCATSSDEVAVSGPELTELAPGAARSLAIIIRAYVEQHPEILNVLEVARSSESGAAA